MRARNLASVVCALVLGVIGIGVPGSVAFAQDATPAIDDPATRTALAQAAAVQAAESQEWVTYADPVFGFTVQMPNGWTATPGDGAFGSVTRLEAPRDAQTGSAPLAVQIGVLRYDKSPIPDLRGWVHLPDEIADQVTVDAARPTLYSAQVVVESYTTGEGPVRRAYIARGSKVYFVDLAPDSATYDALFSYMLLSLVFTDAMERPQESLSQLYGSVANLYLPLLKGGNPALAAQAATVAGAEPATAPTAYRLPFVGEAPIIQGPGCGVTHQGKDYEAIDFALPSGTDLVAAQSGFMLRFPDLVGYGNTVKILHPDGRRSWYSHLREFGRETGPVLRGQYIGASGGADEDPGRGASVQAHVHFMVLGAHTRRAEWIRTLPGITWFSANPEHPCNDGTYGYAKGERFLDGFAVGPALDGGEPATCTAPELRTPEDGAIIATPIITLTWGPGSCTGLGYLLRIRTSADMEQGGDLVLEVPKRSDRFVGEVPPRWRNRDLYWSVKTLGVPNAAWAPARKLRVAAPPPPNACPAPELQTPDDGATFPGGTITFGWSEPPCAHVGFVLIVRTGSKLDGEGETVLVTANGTTQATATIGGRWYNRDLFWSVRAAGADGSAWATPQRFRIVSEGQLGVPTPLSPAQGTVLANNADVIFTWNAVDGATRYKVELSGGPLGPLTICEGREGTSCRVGRLWPGAWSWRVMARNASGQESDWSPALNFTVQVLEPPPSPGEPTPAPPTVARPDLREPAAGGVLPRTSDITLRWDSAANAVQYKVELWGGPYSVMTPCDWQTDTACHIGVMSPGIMLWRVKARGSEGQESAWSEPRAFAIQE